ncbi:MAG TPA: hypothetical protein PKE42_11995, partial [Arachnia sp.]|nr:hypothetical protein [Arachnia sp.]
MSLSRSAAARSASSSVTTVAVASSWSLRSLAASSATAALRFSRTALRLTCSDRSPKASAAAETAAAGTAASEVSLAALAERPRDAKAKVKTAATERAPVIARATMRLLKPAELRRGRGGWVPSSYPSSRAATARRARGAFSFT